MTQQTKTPGAANSAIQPDGTCRHCGRDFKDDLDGLRPGDSCPSDDCPSNDQPRAVLSALTNLEKILYVANGAYPDRERRLSQTLPNGERGDNLGDFIHSEISDSHDTSASLQDSVDGACRELFSAIRLLERVAAAIEELTLRNLSHD